VVIVTALLDNNVLIRFLTADRSLKYKNLYPFFKAMEQGEKRVELKLIILFQTVFVLKSFYKVPKELIAEGMLDLIEYKGIFIKEKSIVRRTLELWRDTRIEIVDCYLIACTEGSTQNLLYSYDRDFDQFNIPRKEP
jgi:predicted nucleic-acid-binding protein